MVVLCKISIHSSMFAGLIGKTNLETYRIEELQEAVVELFQSFIKTFHEKDETKKVKISFFCVIPI